MQPRSVMHQHDVTGLGGTQSRHDAVLNAEGRPVEQARQRARSGAVAAGEPLDEFDDLGRWRDVVLDDPALRPFVEPVHTRLETRVIEHQRQVVALDGGRNAGVHQRPEVELSNA